VLEISIPKVRFPADEFEMSDVIALPNISAEIYAETNDAK
jgi:hypothetical protein